MTVLRGALVSLRPATRNDIIANEIPAMRHGFTVAVAAQARFWRGDQARVGPGTGLGLSIVAGIAAEHGGTATAANAPTGGAVFTLRLPASAALRDRDQPAR